MNTNDLINMLAADAEIRRPSRLALAVPLGTGALLSTLFVVLVLGIRPDLAQLAGNGLFWVKCLFVAVLAIIGIQAFRVAATPGVRFSWLPWLFGMPLLLIGAAAAVTLMDADAASRAAQFWGRTWRSCPFLIALLSLPIFAALLHCMRQFAPTRLRLAGAIAGFASGALAALLYCLHCPELAPPFVGVWYLTGMLIPTAIGAAAGPRLLAW